MFKPQARRTTPPSPYAELDRSHPLASEIVIALNLTGTHARNAVNKDVWTRTSLKNDYSARGISTKSTSPAANGKLTSPTAYNFGTGFLGHTNQVTICTDVVGAEVTNWRTLYTLDASDYEVNVFVQINGDGSLSAFSQANIGADFTTGAGVLASGENADIAYVCDFLNGAIIYKNGVSIYNFIGTVFPSNTSTFPQVFHVDNLSGRAAGHSGTYFYVWPRVLRADEIRSIARNPWQIYVPTQYREWMDAVTVADFSAYDPLIFGAAM